MAQEEREQERETMDKTTLCYCTPNYHKLVCRAHCGGVLASYIYFHLKKEIVQELAHRMTLLLH